MLSFKHIRNWAFGAATACAATASLAAPVVININQGFTFEAYTGTTPLYVGQVDIDNTLFYVREASVNGIQAWTIFFDPRRGQRLTATLDFGAPILDIFSTSAALDSSALLWGLDLNRDGFSNDYHSNGRSGLERNDTIGWTAGGSLLALSWNASDPGDHVRVLVQDVPEPSTIALALLALGGLGAAQLLRRKAASAAGSTDTAVV